MKIRVRRWLTRLFWWMHHRRDVYISPQWRARQRALFHRKF